MKNEKENLHEILMHFFRSLKTKGLLDKDIHGSMVATFIHSELPFARQSNQQSEVSEKLNLADVSGNGVAVCMCTTSTYNAITDNCLKCGKKYSG